MERAGHRVWAIALGTVLAAFSTGEAPAGVKLQEVLRARGLPVAPAAVPNLDKPIASYATFDNQKNFLIAYYLDDGSGLLKEPLLLSAFDKVSQQWRSGEIWGQQLRENDAACFGSILRIDASPSAYYLDTHINPSAGCIVIVSKDLSVRGSLYGWFLAAFRDGTIVYHNSQIHFAPVHAAEISVYDVNRGRDIKIYPMKPYQRVRAEHIGKLRAFYKNEKWCREHNHPCDPEWFDSALAGSVAVSDATSALAFVIRFDNTSYWSDTERLRLEVFRGVREALEKKLPAGGEVPDEYILGLHGDIAGVERLGQTKQLSALFEGDPELRFLMLNAAAARKSAGENWGAFRDALDRRWKCPATWERLAKAIAVPPEFTEVVYVYRNVNNHGPIEYRELLKDDFEARFGSLSLANSLEPEILRRIFSEKKQSARPDGPRLL